MNIAPTLTAEEFKNLHNARCEVHAVLQSLDGVINERVQAQLQKAIDLMNAGLVRAYLQEDEVYQRNQAHYDEVSKAGGFKTIWAMEEVTDLYGDHGFAADILLYKDHFGDAEVSVEIPGPLWAHLWQAAEFAIKASGDHHHVFIENFTLEGNVVVLSTGS